MRQLPFKDQRTTPPGQYWVEEFVVRETPVLVVADIQVVQQPGRSDDVVASCLDSEGYGHWRSNENAVAAGAVASRLPPTPMLASAKVGWGGITFYPPSPG